jgi:hypothetical protein
MLGNRFIEAAVTKYLFVTVFLIFILIVGIYAFLLNNNFLELNKLAGFVDAVFKAMAVLLGLIWTLNRYYIKRSDTTQLRVEYDLNTISFPETGSGSEELALLIFRLDVVNTGGVLIPVYQQNLRIESVTPLKDDIKYDMLYQWPDSGTDTGGPIEPGSWSALNGAVPIPAGVRAVRIFIGIQLPDNPWTWEKTLDVSGGKNNGKG